MTKTKQEENKLEYLMNKERKERYINYILAILIILFLVIALIYINISKPKKLEELAYNNVSNIDTSDNNYNNTNFIRFIYDGFNHNNPPSMNNYIIKSVSCNNAKGSWDSKKWQLNLAGIVDKISCSLYFEKKVNIKKDVNKTKIIKKVNNKKNLTSEKNNAISNNEIIDEKNIEYLNNKVEDDIDNDTQKKLFNLDECSNNDECDYIIIMEPNKSFNISQKLLEEYDVRYILLKNDNAINLYSNGIISSKNVANNEAYIKASFNNQDIIIKVVVEAKLLNTRIYDINRHNETINKIELKTNINTFINNMMNKSDYIHIFDKNNNEIIESNKYIGNGMKAKLIINGILYDELNLLVLGDVDGDGMCTTNDQELISKHIYNQIQLTGLSFLAADVNKDNVVNSYDYELLFRYLNSYINTFIVN